MGFLGETADSGAEVGEREEAGAPCGASRQGSVQKKTVKEGCASKGHRSRPERATWPKLEQSEPQTE